MGLVRDRTIRIAVEVSILVHLLLAWLLPRGSALLLAIVPKPPPVLAQVPDQEQDPIRFELVELPAQREEEPSQRDAPASDLSRRAHGGQGAPADRPAVAGSTPELRLSPAAPGQAPATVPPGRPDAPDQLVPEEPSRVTEVPSGAGAVLRPREAESPQPSRPVLRGLSPLAQPPAAGGAVPDRTGGQVDLGPLSFDTQWYNWGPYAAEMLRRIRYHWSIPEIAQLGVQGVVRVRFVIERDGRVSDIQVQRESGHPPMDFAARDAILLASPLPPLPADLTGVQREGVTITFYYNVRPPDQGR